MPAGDSPTPTRFAGLDRAERRRRLGLAVLVAAALVVQLSLVIRMLVAIGQGFLPHDFLAYDGAARHLLAGQPLYDRTATETGGLGLFLYPPSFALLMLPMTLVPSSIGAPIWMFGLVVVGLVAVWLMPVSRLIRWGLTVALGLSYPFLDAVAQGQVGPVLLLLFVIGWRAIAGRRAALGRERAIALGIVLGLGTTIKIQPAISIAWAVLTRRFRAAIIAIAIAGGLALVATVIVGPQAWFDLAAVLARTNEPVNTRNSVGIARVAFELGASPAAAYDLYVVGIVGSAVAVLVAIRYGSTSSSYLVAAIASQMVSPVVWAHYAVVLVLPVAWLLARRRWWAILLLVPTLVPLAEALPSIVYPIVFWATTLAVVREGVLERRAFATRETLREQGIPDPGAILAG